MNESVEASSNPKWQKIIFAILVAEGMTVGAFGITIPVLPYILENLFNLQDLELIWWNSQMFVVSSAAMALFSPIWGVLADKLGKRLMLIRAMLGGMIVLLLMSFVQTPLQLLILRAFQGAFTGSIAAATVLILAYTPDKQRATTLALLQVAIYAGNSLGPLVGGVLYDQLSSSALGGRANFFFTSLILGLSAFIVFKFVPKDVVTKKEPSSNTKRFRLDFSLLTQRPLLMILLFASAIVSISFALVTPIFPLFVKTIVESSENLGKISGLIIGSAALAVAIGAIVFARLGKFFAMEYLVLIAIIGAALFYIPQVYATSWQMLLAFRLLDSFFIGGITPGLNYLISSYAPADKHGAVFGLVASLNAIGMAIGPAIGIKVVGNGHFHAAFITGTGLLLALAIILISTKPIVKKEKQALITQAEGDSNVSQ